MIGAVDEEDVRTVAVPVAGPAALIVAKAFKLGERLDNPRRLLPKDAGDVFRLYEAHSVKTLVERFERVAADERSAAVTRTALGYLKTLFATPRSPGIELAVAALGPLATQYGAEQMLADYTRSCSPQSRPEGAYRNPALSRMAMSVGRRRCCSRARQGVRRTRRRGRRRLPPSELA